MKTSVHSKVQKDLPNLIEFHNNTNNWVKILRQIALSIIEIRSE